jgi:glycosyltransferase involved in cell wall biosynthesis
MFRGVSKGISSTNLTVIIPCFNEESTIHEVLNKVLAQNLVGQVIIVDDGSTDSSVSVIQTFKDIRIKLIRNEKNCGKGRSIWIGIQNAQLEYLIIQDADLEYNPLDFSNMLDTAIRYSADAVYGSRFLTAGPRRALYYWHRMGNLLLTSLSNAFTNVYLTDMETGYKLIRTDVAKKLNLKENRFGVEPEITAKLAKIGAVIYEVPIRYTARTYAEGKKIGWKDAISALRCIVKYSLFTSGKK